LTEVEDEIMYIAEFDLNTHAKYIIKEIKGNYVKADCIVQNETGTRFCLPYFNGGRFKLYIFDD